MRNTLIFVVLVTTIFSFRLFDQVWILTQGGPDNATTTVMFQAVTAAFTENNVGRGRGDHGDLLRHRAADHPDPAAPAA